MVAWRIFQSFAFFNLNLNYVPHYLTSGDEKLCQLASTFLSSYFAPFELGKGMAIQFTVIVGQLFYLSDIKEYKNKKRQL